MSTAVLPYRLDTVLDTLDRQEAEAPTVLPDAFFSNLADVLDDAAMAQSGSELEHTGLKVRRVLDHLFRSLPAEIRNEILAGEQEGAAAFQVYQLGQLAFAQLFATQHGHKRASQEFFDLLRKNAIQPYVRALLEAERNNHELSVILGHTEEHVSRSLKQLRLAGITDFRKDGRLVINFLTPPARKIAEQQKQDDERVAAHHEPRAPLTLTVNTQHASVGPRNADNDVFVYGERGVIQHYAVHEPGSSVSLRKLREQLEPFMRELQGFGSVPV